MDMYKVMTVCTGNICRSPTGEFLLKDAAARADLPLQVASSGISNEERGNPIDRRAQKVLDELGIDATTHRAQQFNSQDFYRFDLILAMDTNHHQALKRLAPNDAAAAKVRLMREFDPAVTHLPLEDLGIYDPWYGDQEDFYETFEMIRAAVPGVLAYVEEALESQ